MLTAAFGLAAAFAFGTGDYLVRDVTRRLGWAPTLLAVHVASVPVLLAALWLGPWATAFPAEHAPRLLALGLLNFLGSVGLVRALAVGVLSLVSPIASTFAVVTAAWSFAFGATVGAGLWAGIGATVVGIVLAGWTGPDPRAGRRLAAGALWAMVSSVSFGTVFFFLAPASADAGPVWPVLALRAVGAALAPALLLGRAGRPRPPVGGRVLARLAAVALLDTAGLVLYTLGTLGGDVALVAVLASCFSVVTVWLAQVHLRERLHPWQWAGLALLLAGVAWSVHTAGP